MGCNNNSNSGTNNGRCSKKQKQKQRVPQRGLGVAQLEKIRLEEQHHHHGIFPPPSAAIVIPPTQATTKTSSSSISKVQSHLSVSNFPTFQSSQKNLRHRHSLYGSFHGYNKRSNDYSGEASCSGGEGFPFWGSSSGSSRIPNESNPKPNPTLIWPIQRAAHHQQYESMVGIPTPNSSSSSTIINFHQMEPPSNQSFYSNLSSTGDWAAEEEEEKTIGMKRAHPLSNYEQDSISIAGAGAGSSSVPLPLPPPPSFMMYQSSSSMKKQYPSVVHHHHHHESPSSFNFGSGPVFNFTSSNPPYFRDGSSGWNVTWQPDSRRAARDNNAATPIPTTTFPGEFLTLGISNTTPTTSRRQRQVSDSSFFHHPKMFELEPSNHSHHHHHHHHQGLNEEEDSADDSRQQRVCYAGSSSGSLFLPSKFMQDETNSVEHVDLNLKL
ncbi:hypothetical protein LINPERHAP1_LOCUS37890 [Linum perenne]